MPEKPKKHEERLMSAFGFDEADLEANRVGQFSQHQAAELTASYWSRARALAFFSAIALAALYLQIVVISASTDMGVFLVLGAVVLALLLAALAPAIYRLRADLLERQVFASEGRITLSLKHKQSSNEYYLQVGEWLFPITEESFLSLKNGDPYRVYHIRRSKHILSLEWLRENDDNLIVDADDAQEAADVPPNAGGYTAREKSKYQSE